MRALALCGGPGHPIDEVRGVLDLLFETVEAHGDVDAGLGALDPARHDVLVVAALAFTMTDRRYDDVREHAAYHLPADGREAISSWIAGGHSLLALHTAVICFDDWPEWGSLLGARWDWDRSWHPPIGEVDVEVLGGGRFTVVDECYRDLVATAERDVVASCDGQPVVWRRRAGDAAVVVDVLGHDRRSLEDPDHVALLERQLDWTETPRP